MNANVKGMLAWFKKKSLHHIIIDDDGHYMTDEEKAALKGLNKFEYPDGFVCYALNKKSADKKYKKWINATPEAVRGQKII